MRDLIKLAETASADTVSLKPERAYTSEENALDYAGADFNLFAILSSGRKIGEITVQSGSRTATVRNVVLYDDKATGKGIGKQVYLALKAKFLGKLIRSSFNMNRAHGTTSQGLSEQAIQMWNSLVARGMATKLVASDRFYYALT